MQFNSFVFLLFFLVVYALHELARRSVRAQNLLLLGASWVFYAAWDWRFLGLLILSTLVDWFIALRMPGASPRGRKALLGVSLTGNLGMLALFKYADFFIESMVELLAALGVATDARRLGIVLPVGISFYTFQTLSYTVDVYRGQLPPRRSLLDFALYVAFFPQLVAGPIERATRLLPQLELPRRASADQRVQGSWLILWGLFKKVVIADTCASWVDAVYDAPAPVGSEVLLATYAFAYQIYCDFSGYSDIARGLGKLLGIELMRNFERPYLARSPSDLWHRWHVSLSTWLRDYLYIPLGGSWRGTLLTYRNLMLTMLLGGLWHGAAWNFVLWGGFHGALLALERRWRGSAAPPRPGWVHALAVVGTFHLTCFGWLLFRATSLAHIGRLLSGFGSTLITEQAARIAGGLLFLAGLLWAIELWLENADDPRTRPGWNALGPLVVGGLLALLILLAPPEGRRFLYFQF